MKFITIQDKMVLLSSIEFISEVKEYKTKNGFLYGIEVCMKSGKMIIVKDRAKVVIDKIRSQIQTKIKNEELLL